MTDDDKLWGFLGKKRNVGSTQPVPVQQVAQPVSAPQPKAVKPKVKPVKAPKPKKIKAQEQVLKSAQTPQYNLADFRIQTATDFIGIHVITAYFGNPVHHFILHVAQYGNWQNSPQQIKYNFVQARTPAYAFFNDPRLIQMVVTATVNAIDNLFMRARQAQAQQQAQKRIRSEGDDRRA